MEDKKRKKSELLEERSQRLKEEIQAKQKRTQERKMIEELGKRITLARDGRSAFEKGQFAHALNCYRKYIILTEQQFKRSIQELKPSHFEDKNRTQESILISAIGLDMAIMLDKLKSPDAAAERRLNLGIFVRFSVGLPFQHFAAENLRRYMEYSTNLQHRKEFKSALSAVSKGKFCLVATLVYQDSDCAELVILREFRDSILCQWKWGEAFVSFYYQNGHRVLPAWNRFGFLRGTLAFFVKKILVPMATMALKLLRLQN